MVRPNESSMAVATFWSTSGGELRRMTTIQVGASVTLRDLRRGSHLGLMSCRRKHDMNNRKSIAWRNQC